MNDVINIKRECPSPSEVDVKNLKIEDDSSPEDVGDERNNNNDEMKKDLLKEDVKTGIPKLIANIEKKVVDANGDVGTGIGIESLACIKVEPNVADNDEVYDGGAIGGTDDADFKGENIDELRDRSTSRVVRRRVKKVNVQDILSRNRRSPKVRIEARIDSGRTPPPQPVPRLLLAQPNEQPPEEPLVFNADEILIRSRLDLDILQMVQLISLKTFTNPTKSLIRAHLTNSDVDPTQSDNPRGMRTERESVEFDPLREVCCEQPPRKRGRPRKTRSSLTVKSLTELTVKTKPF